jgi:hypothetical protein
MSAAAKIALEMLSGARPLPKNYPAPGLVNEFVLKNGLIFQCISDEVKYIPAHFVCRAPADWEQDEVRLAAYKSLVEIWDERKTSGTKKLRLERMRALAGGQRERGK